ncbi:MAG: UDP-N-acetylenolpyruvoylglucosamine reductase [Candidatus Melainabacteria bacterium]|nr:MAG: UDP-N-acetylenolpyruvoylglucosamine reductase [Candidatus Melainabacteria bacterium]
MEEREGEQLSRFTTLKIGGTAKRLCQPQSIDELVALMADLKARNEPWYVIGGGSNLLVSSKGVEGTVIRTAQITKIDQLESNLLEAGAGARLPHLARYAASLGLSGLEFAVGIPGTVGGGVIMNAGAHGSCMADIIDSVTIFDTATGEIATLTNEELEFKYRKSRLDPTIQVVLSARLRLKSDLPETIEAHIRANEEYRWRTQPIGWPNAGSTFKNPDPKKGAGLLLDQAGAKKLAEGKAAVSAVHANFVINMGGATSEEVSKLMKRMQDCVYETFSVRLQPEWKTLGEFTENEREVWKV